MEENIQDTQPVENQVKQAKPWLKIVLFSISGLLLAGGLVWAGVQIGKQQAIRDTQYAIRISPAPEPTATLISTFPPEATLSPLPSEAPAKKGDEIAGWKSYTNTKYRYSIKYPPEFSYRVSEKGEAMIAFDPSQEVLESPAAEDKTLIIITADTSKPVIDKSYFGEPAQIAEETEVIIDGEIGQQVVFSEPVAWIQTAVAHGKRSFYFNLQNMQYRLEYNQILSTFKFLD